MSMRTDFAYAKYAAVEHGSPHPHEQETSLSGTRSTFSRQVGRLAVVRTEQTEEPISYKLTSDFGEGPDAIIEYNPLSHVINVATFGINGSVKREVSLSERPSGRVVVVSARRYTIFGSERTYEPDSWRARLQAKLALMSAVGLIAAAVSPSLDPDTTEVVGF